MGDWSHEFHALPDDTQRAVRAMAQKFGVPLMHAFYRAKSLGLLSSALAHPGQESCEYCGPGKYTGLPGGACENCMGTGLKYPERALAIQNSEYGPAMKRIYLKLAEEGGGTWATYMMMEIDEAFSALALPLPVQESEPVGYVTKNELTKLRLGVSCVDLFGKVVPAGFEMVPLYLSSSTAESVCGRWRMFEAATGPGYWGIELEQAGNDDDAIMYPIKVHRDTVARIVDAHNAALSPSPSIPEEKGGTEPVERLRGQPKDPNGPEPADSDLFPSNLDPFSSLSRRDDRTDAASEGSTE